MPGLIDVGRLGLFVSRPFLEGWVRARVRALSSVTFVEGADIVGLMTTPDQRRVTGATVRGPDGQPQQITAGLVVDTTGRGSHTPVWLRSGATSVRLRIESKLAWATPLGHSDCVPGERGFSNECCG
jgi:hypothetical protein